MAWTAIAPPSADYQSEIWLEDDDGLIWSDKGTERPRLYEDAPPTRQWAAGEWGWDSREVATLSGTPPGQYDIVVTLFDKATLTPGTLIDAAGSAVGPTAVIGQIEIVNPSEPPSFAPQYPAERDFPALGLRLLGYNQDRAEAAAGDSVLLTLFWECYDAMLCERFSLRLENEAGESVREWQLPTIRGGFPAEAWAAHGRLRGQHVVQLPAGMTSGRYRFYLEEYPLGEITVTAPARQFTSPTLVQQLRATFNRDDTAIATLAGIAADSPLPSCSPAPLPGVSCALALVWRAETETPMGYHVFVHLVDETGAILAQSDGIPGNWTRPTTGWLRGEYVIDSHALNVPSPLPPGPLSVRVGLYNPDDGVRLTTDGAEYMTIPLAP
jgi:hypothetical protein